MGYWAGMALDAKMSEQGRVDVQYGEVYGLPIGQTVREWSRSKAMDIYRQQQPSSEEVNDEEYQIKGFHPRALRPI